MTPLKPFPDQSQTSNNAHLLSVKISSNSPVRINVTSETNSEALVQTTTTTAVVLMVNPKVPKTNARAETNAKTSNPTPMVMVDSISQAVDEAEVEVAVNEVVAKALHLRNPHYTSYYHLLASRQAMRICRL